MSTLGGISVSITLNKLVAGGTAGGQLAFLGFLWHFLGRRSTRLGHGFHPLLLLRWWGPIIFLIAITFIYPGCFLPRPLIPLSDLGFLAFPTVSPADILLLTSSLW